MAETLVGCASSLTAAAKRFLNPLADMPCQMPQSLGAPPLSQTAAYRSPSETFTVIGR